MNTNTGQGQSEDLALDLERQMTEDEDSYCLHRVSNLPLPTLSISTSCLRQQVDNQIDFILTLQCFKSSINKTNTRSFPSANSGSDHDLVLAS